MALFSARFDWNSSSWNFSEAGHGKSAADGIGAVVKRTADQSIAHGLCDITTPETFIKCLKDVNSQIELFVINRPDIETIDNYLPLSLQTIPNTMRIHQVVWASDSPRILGLRELSCNACSQHKICDHFSLLPATWTFPANLSVLSDEVRSVNEHSDTSYRQISCMSRSTILTSAPQNSVMCISLSSDIGRWCIIKYNDSFYPGSIVDVEPDRTLVNSLHPIGHNKFIKPNVEDNLWYEHDDIVSFIDEPLLPTPRSRFVVVKDWNKIVKAEE